MIVPNFVVIILTVTHCTVQILGQRPIVETNVGTIRGLRADNGNFSMFMGIPFAQVNPDNVFGNAVPHPRFEGIFDAVDDSAMCPQVEEINSTFAGSLDCLKLNVYVPDAVNVSRPLPVMVYIYGGAFIKGFAGRILYGPEYIIRYDVILVTLSYRTGPYGFLCLDIPEVSGNQGLKDQVLALRWVQHNIAAFGGDPNKVTIFGNSAGGMSANLHLLSNYAPMYKNVIIQSGSIYRSAFGKMPNSTVVFQLAELLGNQTNNVYEALSFLNQVEPRILIELIYSRNDIEFTVCIESSRFPEVPTFLNNFPINIKHLPHLQNISIMMGNNRYESHNNYVTRNREYYLTWATGIFREELESGFNFNESLLNELEYVVRNFYMGDSEINYEVRREVADFVSDTLFIYPQVRSKQINLDNNIKNLFFYLFSYAGGRNYIQILYNVTSPLALHADEIGYLFDMRYIPVDVTPEDQLIIDRMTTMWTNFAKYSNPTPQTSTLLPVKWEPITKNSPFHYLDINTQMSANISLFHSRMAFWDLFHKAYEKYQEGYGYQPSYAVSVSVKPFFNFIVLTIYFVIPH